MSKLAKSNVLVNGEGTVSCVETAEDMANRLVAALNDGGPNVMLAIERPSGTISYRLAGLIMGFDTIEPEGVQAAPAATPVPEKPPFNTSTDQD